MTITTSQLEAVRRVAIATGAGVEKATATFRTFGKGGLAGIALHAGGPLDGYGYASPFHPVKDAPPTNPGRITSKGGVLVVEVAEPENSDDEMVRDPAGLITRPMRVLFPNRQYAADQK